MLKILFKHFKWQHWLLLFLCVGLIFGEVWLDLKMPEYTFNITYLIKMEGSMSEIWANGGYMLACALGSTAMAVIVCFFSSIISSGIARDIRSSVFQKVLDFSKNEIKKFSTASLITRSTNDVTQIRMIVSMGLQIIIKAPILAIWSIIKLVNVNWQWTVTTAVAVAILVLVIVCVVLIALPKFKKMQALTDDVNRVTRENLTGLRVVRAYNAEPFQEDKFEKANEKLTKTSLFANRVMIFMSPVISLIMSGLTLAVNWIGADLINSASSLEKVLLNANMMTVTTYAMQVVLAFMLMTMIFIMLPRASVSAKRINEILETSPSIVNGNGATSTITGKVEFKNVSFKYPDADEYVLKDISFVANKGETVAFIGSTGSGKSTLIDLIPRFYDATEGQILVDDIDVKDYTLQQLHNKLGYISQKAVLFSGTVKSNICFGDDADKQTSDEDVAKALEIAQASDFVNKMPEKENSTINQGGKNVSGGQKQRLSIARAVARKPEVFIFDDSFSALDYKTDKKLRKALDKELSSTTRLIVAQRIGTIKNADKILVLDNGELVGMGRHEQLIKNCKVYQEIALSQLSKEELS